MSNVKANYTGNLMPLAWIIVAVDTEKTNSIKTVQFLLYRIKVTLWRFDR